MMAVFRDVTRGEVYIPSASCAGGRSGLTGVKAASADVRAEEVRWIA